MKKIALVFVLFVIGNQVYSQTPAKRENILTFLELTGSAKLGIQVIQNMSESYKKALPSVPVEFWDEAMKEIKADSLVELIVPIYTKHFTDEDILQLIEFYKSPLGKKLAQKLPAITQEAMVVGEEWGRKIGERITFRLTEKGYLMPAP